MAIIGIVAVDLNNGIGKDGQLLFHIKEDLQHFKELTLGKAIVLGHRTLGSFPNGEPLFGRTNIVLSHNAQIENCINVHSISEILDLAKTQDLYIVGGASLYKQMLPYYDELILTQVYANKNADAFFPQIDKNQLEICNKSVIIKTKDYDIQFIKYKRKEKEK